jgi:hypothetical protein
MSETKNLFVELGLAPELIQAVTDLGYTEPTLVQQACIPKAMKAVGEGQAYADLMVSSQTGSGKTAAFLLPVLHTLLEQQDAKEAQEKAEWDRQVQQAAAEGKPEPKRPKRKNPLLARHFQPVVPGALVLCPCDGWHALPNANCQAAKRRLGGGHAGPFVGFATQWSAQAE